LTACSATASWTICCAESARSSKLAPKCSHADHLSVEGTKGRIFVNRDCVTDRKETIPSVSSHHRALSTRHLSGIAARLGRKIKWDPKKEQMVGDAQAQALVAREKRKGFEIEMG
jgi:hypothetical protein